MPVTTELPFLVVHGWWLSKALLFVAAAMLVVLFLFARRLIRAIALRRQPQTTPLREGAVVLRGVLHGPRLVTRIHPGADASVAEALESGDGNWLDFDGTRVDIEGCVHVVVGSRSRATWWGGTRVSRPENSKYPHAGSRMDNIVREGDAVIVSGSAVLRSTSEAGEDKGRWMLSGMPLELRALNPATTAPALGPWLVPITIIATVIAFFGLGAFGQHLVEREQSNESFDHRLLMKLESDDALAIAAALPRSRDAALKEIERHLEIHVGRTEIAIRQRVALARLRHGCVGGVYEWQKVGLHEEAVGAAANCGDTEDLQVKALLYLGWYERAAGLTAAATLPQKLLSLIATRRWYEAALVVEQLGSETQSKQDADRLLCIAELLKWYGGDKSAAVRLSSAPGNSGACRIATALASDTNSAEALLEINHSLAREDRHWDAAWQIAWMHGAMSKDDAGAVYGLSSPVGDAISPFIAPLALQRDDSRGTRAWGVVYHVLRGDFAKAMAAVRQPSPPVEDAHDNNALGLDIAVQLRAGNTSIDTKHLGSTRKVHRGVRELVAIREGQGGGAPEQEIVSTPLCKTDVTDAMAAAEEGNGAPLLRLLQTCRLYPTSIQILLAVAPRVRTDRAALSAASRYALYDDSLVRAPFGLVQQLAWRRDLARAFGGTAEVARLQGIIERHLDAFASREQLAAWLLVEAL